MRQAHTPEQLPMALCNDINGRASAARFRTELNVTVTFEVAGASRGADLIRNRQIFVAVVKKIRFWHFRRKGATQKRGLLVAQEK